MLSTPLVTSGYYCDDKQYTWTTTVLTGSGVSGLKGALTVKGRGSRGWGCPLQVPSSTPEPSLQSCSTTLAPAPSPWGLTLWWCRVPRVLLSSSGQFLWPVLVPLQGCPHLPQYELPYCPLWAGVMPSLVKGDILHGISPSHRTMPMWECSGYGPSAHTSAQTCDQPGFGWLPDCLCKEGLERGKQHLLWFWKDFYFHQLQQKCTIF